MTRPRATLAPLLVALALVLGACGGGDDDDGSNTNSAPANTSPSPSEPPSEGAPPSGGQLPAELVECFADNGVEVESPDEIHSAPPEVVQKCFSALHGGGGP